MRTPISFRKSRPEDSKKIFTWRNLPEIRSTALNPEPIEWEQHLSWYNSKAEDPKCLLLIAQTPEDDVGVLRLDYISSDRSCYVSIYVLPNHWGHGFAYQMLCEADDIARENFDALKFLKIPISQVAKSNNAESGRMRNA